MVRSMVVIDDNTISNILVTKLIEYEKVAKRLQTFQYASKALDYLAETIGNQKETFPEIIFLDVNMPQMDGWEFLQEYMKLPSGATRNCHLFMLSSSISEQDIEKAKDYSVVTDYISKPITREILRDIHKKYFYGIRNE